MPREFQKRGRGRRGQEKEKKEKKENILDELRARAEPDGRPAKRQRLSPPAHTDEVVLDQPDYTGNERTTSQQQGRTYEVTEVGGDQEAHDERPESQFFGFLDEAEQAFLKRIDLILANNSFESPDDKPLFLNNAWAEVTGKELKIACSQSCSRVLERLIKASNRAQLKGAWSRMRSNFVTLSQHRFASHVVEALLTTCAPFVTDELLGKEEEDAVSTEQFDDEETLALKQSMESYYLELTSELQDNLGYLMTNQFASHTLRVLLLALSGRPLAGAGATSILQSKKKEKIIPKDDANPLLFEQRVVPDVFKQAVSGLAGSALAGLDTNYLRAIATNPLANPVLQLFLELEFAAEGRQKAKDQSSLYRRLLPDDPPSEGTQSASFIKGLLFDPVGSRLLETIVQCAPGKTFKVIYRNFFKENLANIVRNEIAGFVVIKILERLGQDELRSALEEVLPQLGALIERSRHSTIRCLIERCRVRSVSLQGVADALTACLSQPGKGMLVELLQPDITKDASMSADRSAQLDREKPNKLHASMLAQTMLAERDILQEVILRSLLESDSAFLAVLGKDRTATHVLQAALNPALVEKNQRRQLVQKLMPVLMDLALDRVGSHVVDALAKGTAGLQFLRERIAEDLLRNERQIRDGETRAIWKNWMMNMYQWKRADWANKMKEQDGEQGDSQQRDQQSPSSGPNFGKGQNGKQHARGREAAAKPMTPIEAARARYAQQQKKGGRGMGWPGPQTGTAVS